MMEQKSNVEYPFDYKELGPEDVEEAKKYFTPVFSKIARLGSKGYYFYDSFVDIVSDIYNMEVRPSDSFVVTFPRSGTTWMQELVWLLQNECDFERAKQTSLMIRFPFIESGSFLQDGFKEHMPNDQESKQFLSTFLIPDLKSIFTMPSPRFLKSHLPLSLLPPSLLDTAKVVYVARDPRDVAVSYFFHMRSSVFVPKDKEFKPFWNFFDLPAVARRLAVFFNKEYTDEQYIELCDHLKFDNFKNNASVNMKDWQDKNLLTENFVRKGKSGGWREHFDAEMTQQAEAWIADNLRDTDLRFPTIN